MIGDLWERYGTLDANDLSDEARTVAKQCILDWFGCAIAGSDEPLTGILRDELSTADGEVSLVGSERKASLTHAALINGAAGHALDFDDTSVVMGGHPTVPVLPAVLALAESRGATGAELLAAFVAGIEVESRIGPAVGPGQYLKGWHMTSTIGVFGATAACARLLDLDAETFGRAIGLAASQSGGLKVNFGTMTKPFHAGFAAERGLLSARLAARGFTASGDALAGKQGYAEAAGDGELHLDAVKNLEDEWLVTHALFKYHAACYLTHASIEIAGGMRSEIGPGDVETAKITVSPALLDVCAIPKPTTGLEAKFSLAAATCFALIGADTTDHDTFTDERVQRDDLQSMLGKFEIATDESLAATQSRLEIDTSDGRRLAGEYDTGVPATDLAAQGEKLHAKFFAQAGTRNRASAEKLAGLVADIEICENAADLLRLV